MLSRSLLTVILFVLLAFPSTIASGMIGDAQRPVDPTFQWPPPPDECSLTDICD